MNDRAKLAMALDVALGKAECVERQLTTLSEAQEQTRKVFAILTAAMDVGALAVASQPHTGVPGAVAYLESRRTG